MHLGYEFIFRVLVCHIGKIMGAKKQNIIKIEQQTNSQIFINNEVSHCSIHISAPTQISLNSACEEILNTAASSQNRVRKLYNKPMIDFLKTLNTFDELLLLQNFGATYTTTSAGVLTFKSWNDDDLTNIVTHIKSQMVAPMQNRTLMGATTPVEIIEPRLKTMVGMDCSKYPKSMNILMLGETGVGKSTFINALINNLKFSSLEEAIESEVEVLIESEFTLTDDNYEEKVIKVKPTHSGKEDKTNEVLTPGQSSTPHPRAYVLEYTHKDEVKEIRIIDTPGIGDTRGDNYDKKNFGNILKFIAEYSEIHAICILMKPNDSRETLVFQYCIDELLVHLHKNASRNILFCFTNSRGTCYKPGDTLKTLKTHLAKLHTNREIRIPVARNTMFCFDSESFRFLCATKQGFVFTDRQKEDYSICWKTSVEETARLFARICDIPVHNTQETLCLNSTRTLILALSDPLARIVEVNVSNRETLQQTIKKITKLASEGKLLVKDLTKKQWVLQMEQIPYPKTVCTSKSCIEFSRIGSGTELKTVYKTVCHAHCYLDSVQEETVPNTTLQNCACMTKSSGSITCRKCKCPWSTHMHIRYNLNKVEIEVEDKETQAQLLLNYDQLAVAKHFTENIRSDIAAYQKEYDTINRSCAEFAAFLAENSILPYSDSYLDYINFLIKIEKNKAEISRNEEMVKRMETYRDGYQEQVRLFKANIENRASGVRTIEEINQMLSDLKKLKHCGHLLVEVQNFEMASIRKTKKNTETRRSLTQIGKNATKYVYNYGEKLVIKAITLPYYLHSFR